VQRFRTDLILPASQIGIRQGTQFCQQNVGIFNEMLSLPKGGDLAVCAASKTLPQPIEVVACPALTRTAQVGAIVRRHVANYSLS
jgi:hypothetical protein